MRRSLLRVVLAAGLLCLGVPAVASAYDETPCGDGLLCSHVAVPLDPSGALPGTIGLDVRRLPAGASPTPTALVVLLGGPGQVSSTVAAQVAGEVAPLAPGRDIVLFDERGVGGSDALSCPALISATAVSRCAASIGPARGQFTTNNDAADVEAIRVAGGYGQIALYGTSYGTKVALVYAAAHPATTERLVLDSTVTPEGPDPLSLSTFAAIPGALRALCTGGACRGVTTDPARDLTTLAHRLARKPIAAHARDGRGRSHKVQITQVGLLNILLAGDLDPVLRAATPAAIRAADRGDPAALGRLRARIGGLSARFGRQGPGDGINTTRFVTTTCEETVFPWDRAAGAATRASQANARIRLLRARQFAPFSRATVAGGGTLPTCLRWPVASPAPVGVTLPPGIPTLLLEGTEDLRTPVADAQLVAARLGAGAQLVVLPGVGHSVLGSDPSGCAAAAFTAFMAGGAAATCEAAKTRIPPDRLPPRSLRSLATYRGVSGTRGRTLTAASRTVTDAARAALSASLESGPARIGGLRAGWLNVDGAGAHLHRYSYVPGVTVSGLIPTDVNAPLRLTVGGRSAAHGTITVAGGHVTGRLGGRSFDIATAAAAALRPRLAAPPRPALARIG